MPSLDWIKEIELDDILSGDVRLIADSCGLDVLIRLWEECPSLSLYISTVPLNEARRRYIRRHYNGSNAKELAARLGVSDRFVFGAVASPQPPSLRGDQGGSPSSRGLNYQAILNK